MLNYSSIQVADVDGVSEPVTLDNVKAWLTIDFADFDSLLTGMIASARRSIEGYINLGLVAKNVTLDALVSQDEELYLPFAVKVSSVVVKALADDDSETPLALGTDYFVRGNSIRGLNEGRYSIAYTTVPVVPEDLKEAIKMEVAERYAQRGENNIKRGSINDLSIAAKVKAAPYQVQWL